MSDPVTKFLADLDDPEKYLRVDGVPLFVPHRRKVRHADGKTETIEVTEADLGEIAEHAAARERESGTPLRVSIGHVLVREPDEKAQPDVVGAAKNLHVGTFGPGKKTGLLCSLYLRRDCADEARGFPFRSVEFYPSRGERGEITGVALLRRDPELDLGMISYASRDGSFLCYSREANMADMPPDPTMPPDADAPGPADAPPDAPAGDADREAYDRHCAGHPYARTHYERMLGYAAAPAAGPGATNDSLPGTPEPEPPPAPYARGGSPLAYARLEAELRQLKRNQEKDRKELERERAARQQAERKAAVVQYERELTAYAAERGIEIDVADEMADVAPEGKPLMSREQFERHLARVEKYQRGPVGDLLPVRTGTPAGQRELTEARLGEAHQYMLEHSVTMAEAVKHVTGAA